MGKSTLIKADRFIRHMEMQGAKVRQTKSGYLVTSIDGRTVGIHKGTRSDHRGLSNEIGQFRRAGLHHPDDKKDMEEVVAKNEEGYPLYITAPITERTRRDLLAELESKGWPLTISGRELSLDPSTANKGLYAVGYRYDLNGKARNRVWNAPADIVELHEKAKAERERAAAEAEHSEQDEMEERPKEEVEEHLRPEGDADVVVAGESVNVSFPDDEPSPEGGPSAGREFIDSVDSWVIAEPPMSLSVAEYLRLLRNAGLEVEIRVWRA